MVLALVGLLSVTVGVIIVIPAERAISMLGPVWDEYESIVQKGHRKARDMLKFGGAFLLFVVLVGLASALFL